MPPPYPVLEALEIEPWCRTRALAGAGEDRLHRQLGGVAGLGARDVVRHGDGRAVVEVADLDGLAGRHVHVHDAIPLTAAVEAGGLHRTEACNCRHREPGLVKHKLDAATGVDTD